MVHSSQVQFTRDGRTLVVAEPDAVTLVELRGGGRRRIAIAGVQAVAAFADQVWVATRTGTLIRLARDGRQLDEHALPVDPDGVLIPTTIDGASALWAARESVMLVDDLGSLAIVPSHIDAGIPVARRRFAHYAGPRVTLPTGRSTTLEGGHRITGGSVVFEGTSIALIAEHAHGRDLAVLALTSGCPLQTVRVPSGTIRIAARRGLAVIHDAARRLTVIDLRSARPLGTIMIDGDATDFAVDPDGSLLAIRLASGELRLAPIGGRMGAATRLRTSLRAASDLSAEHPSSGTPPVEARPSEPEPADLLPSVVRPPEPRPPMIADALEPRPCRSRPPSAAALVKLDREIGSITLWALRASLSAGDPRRRRHGNEGFTAVRDAHTEHEAALATDPEHRSASMPTGELADDAGAVADRERRVARDRGAVAPRPCRAAVQHPWQRLRPSTGGRAARPARPR